MAMKKTQLFDEQVMQQIDQFKEIFNTAAVEYDQIAESYLLGETNRQSRKVAFKNTQKAFSRLMKLHDKYLSGQAYNSSQL